MKRYLEVMAMEARLGCGERVQGPEKKVAVY